MDTLKVYIRLMIPAHLLVLLFINNTVLDKHVYLFVADGKYLFISKHNQSNPVSK